MRQVLRTCNDLSVSVSFGLIKKESLVFSERFRSLNYYITWCQKSTCSGKSEGERVAIFMCMIGKDGQEVKDTFEFQREEDGTDIVTTKILKLIVNQEEILSSIAIVSLRETNSLASQ